MQGELIKVNESLEQTVMQSAQRLNKSEERLRYTLSTINEGIYDIDFKHGTIYRNPWLVALEGVNASEIKINVKDSMDFVHQDDREIFEKFTQNLTSGDQDNYKLQHWVNPKNGHTIWVINKAQIIERVVGTVTDITQEVNYVDKLKRFATQDPITNLPNLLLLKEFIDQKNRTKVSSSAFCTSNSRRLKK